MEDEQLQPSTEEEKKAAKPAKNINWLKISVIANILIVVIIAVGGASLGLIHQSDTNPNFCATCHIMDANVTSYLTSNNLDNVHYQAGVQCKDCHDYPVSAEITSGFKFITGNYEVDETGALAKRTFDPEICTQCHVSLEHVAEKTADLTRNPHDNHTGVETCSTCHVSHGEQIDYCSSCHENGGQTMIGADETEE